MTALDLDGLPFLPGSDAIVQRMADFHEWMTFAEPNNWKELLEAGDRAPTSAGREVASANSSAEAATANLRWKAYEERMNAARSALLGAAHRRLQTRPDFHASLGLVIGLLGFGRDAVGGPLKIVPRSHWEAGSVDWAARTLVIVDGTRWHGVRILDLADVDVETAMRFLDEPEGETPAQSRGAQSPADGTLSHQFERADETQPASTQERPELQPRTNKRVSYTTMARFLAGHVEGLPSGDPNLSEAALWIACKHHFDFRAPNRQMLRNWIIKDMDQAKRKRRGDRSRKSAI